MWSESARVKPEGEERKGAVFRSSAGAENFISAE